MTTMRPWSCTPEMLHTYREQSRLNTFWRMLEIEQTDDEDLEDDWDTHAAKERLHGSELV